MKEKLEQKIIKSKFSLPFRKNNGQTEYIKFPEQINQSPQQNNCSLDENGESLDFINMEDVLGKRRTEGNWDYANFQMGVRLGDLPPRGYSSDGYNFRLGVKLIKHEKQAAEVANRFIGSVR